MLAACAPPTEEPSVPGRGRQPNIVLISLDTLGAKHLSCYGYERETSPVLDEFAEDSILFLDAYAASAKTAESHMSMFTSLYPSVHGVYTRADKNRVIRLGDTVTTLAETLKADGYRTVGFHGGGFVSGQFGFDRGFDLYRRAEQHEAQTWLRNKAGQGKFFLFYHTYHVHDPYTPSPPFDTVFDTGYRGEIVHDRNRLTGIAGSSEWQAYSEAFWARVDKSDPADVEHLVALYDGAIRELDAKLARLFATIERHAPHTVVIVLSDHGEEFGEHGNFLHNQLYDEILRVPLIIRHPGLGGMKVAERVSLIDLAPTILDMAGLPALDQFQGRSLLDGIEVTRQRQAPIYSELPSFVLKSLIERDTKVMSSEEGWELYDLAADPEERNDLHERHPEFVELQKRLQAQATDNVALAEALATAGTEQLLDEETLEQMKALGYVK